MLVLTRGPGELCSKTSFLLTCSVWSDSRDSELPGSASATPQCGPVLSVRKKGPRARDRDGRTTNDLLALSACGVVCGVLVACLWVACGVVVGWLDAGNAAMLMRAIRDTRAPRNQALTGCCGSRRKICSCWRCCAWRPSSTPWRSSTCTSPSRRRGQSKVAPCQLRCRTSRSQRWRCRSQRWRLLGLLQLQPRCHPHAEASGRGSHATAQAAGQAVEVPRSVVFKQTKKGGGRAGSTESRSPAATSTAR